MKSPSPQNPIPNNPIPENQIQGWQTTDRLQNSIREIYKLENDQDKHLRSNLLLRVSITQNWILKCSKQQDCIDRK